MFNALFFILGITSVIAFVFVKKWRIKALFFVFWFVIVCARTFYLGGRFGGTPEGERYYLAFLNAYLILSLIILLASMFIKACIAKIATWRNKK